MKSKQEREKELAALEAVKLIGTGQVVGLGTGSSAEYAIREIGELIRKGSLEIKGGVPTSSRTEELARSLDIPILDIREVEKIDLTIDGADEFTPELALIKGGGGALFREKIVASMSTEMIVIADSSKQVKKLGKFHLPVEVAPFAARYVLAQLKQLGGMGKIREASGSPYFTDQQNYVVDVDFGLIENPEKLSDQLNEIVGVVCHGLFLGLATKVIAGEGDAVRILERK